MHGALSRTLYRSLLRTSKKYVSEKNGAILCSLLYRSGVDDHLDYGSISSPLPSEPFDDQSTTAEDHSRLSPEEARDLTKSYSELKEIHSKRLLMDDFDENESGRNRHPTWESDFVRHSLSPQHVVLYRRLLREAMAERHMNFPFHNRQLDTGTDDSTMGRLNKIIKREFDPTDQTSISKSYSDKERRDAAFLALNVLNKKISWAEDSLGLNDVNDSHNASAAARDVFPLSVNDPSSYLRSGTYLIAHPLLSGCFAKTVICILEHTEPRIGKYHQDAGDNGINKDDEDDDNDENDSIGGTYGLIVNKPLKVGVPNPGSEKTRDRMLRETIRQDCLPEGMKTAFAHSPVRNGGPVNLSIQMLSSLTAELENQVGIGKSVLPMNLNESPSKSGDNDLVLIKDPIRSAASNTDTAIYYGGDIVRASQAVIEGKVDKGMYGLHFMSEYYHLHILNVMAYALSLPFCRF